MRRHAPRAARAQPGEDGIPDLAGRVAGLAAGSRIGQERLQAAPLRVSQIGGKYVLFLCRDNTINWLPYPISDSFQRTLNGASSGSSAF